MTGPEGVDGEEGGRHHTDERKLWGLRAWLARKSATRTTSVHDGACGRADGRIHDNEKKAGPSGVCCEENGRIHDNASERRRPAADAMKDAFKLFQSGFAAMASM